MRRWVFLALAACLALSCERPHLRDRNGDGIISIGLVGASNTVGRMAWSAANPPQAVPPAWNFPSVSERLIDELTAAGVVVQWWVPEEGGFNGLAPVDTSSLQGGMAWSVEGDEFFHTLGQLGNNAFTKIEFAIAQADPPLDAILIGSGEEIEAIAIKAGAMTTVEFTDALTQHVANSAPGALTACGYDLYFLTSTQIVDCNCLAVPACSCCDPAADWPCIPFGGFSPAADINPYIVQVNTLITNWGARAINAGFPLPVGAGFIDKVHHGLTAVEAKVAATLNALLPTDPPLNQCP